MHNCGFSLPQNPLTRNSSSHYISWLCQPSTPGGWSTSLTSIFASYKLLLLLQLRFKCSPGGVYRRFDDVYRPGSRGIHRQTTNSYISSRATLQGYSTSHYTFLVYRQPFPSTCEVTVHPLASLMSYSHGYTELLWTNSTKALHVTSTGHSYFCTSRQGNNFHWHSHP